jgi:hypothetical protein
MIGAEIISEVLHGLAARSRLRDGADLVLTAPNQCPVAC